MKSIIKILTIITVAVMMFLTSSCSRIDAGHAGIKVKLYGSKKGVQDIANVTGTVFFNPFTERVYEVPTYVQTAVYTKDDTEGSEKDEELRVTTRDGLTVSFDVSINYYTPDSTVSYIFKKYRKPLKDLEKGVLRTYIRDAFNNAANRYSAEELYEKKIEFEKIAEDNIREIFIKEGFIVEQVTILNELRLPATVVDNIQAKVNATQIANKKQQEVAQAIADADKLVATARGDSLAAVIRAAGIASSNKLLEKSYTDQILRAKWIDAWEAGGSKVPQYITGSAGNQFMLQMK